MKKYNMYELVIEREDGTIDKSYSIGSKKDVIEDSKCLGELIRIKEVSEEHKMSLLYIYDSLVRGGMPIAESEAIANLVHMTYTQCF